MKIKAVLLLTALASSVASVATAGATDKAKPDTPADYAYALPLQVSGRQGVVAYTLPLSVYLKARTAGLYDLRVFDVSLNDVNGGSFQVWACRTDAPYPENTPALNALRERERAEGYASSEALASLPTRIEQARKDAELPHASHA